jgi:hypothetical protein
MPTSLASVCVSGTGPFDFSDTCIRTTWAALVPAASVAVSILALVPKPAFVTRAFDVLANSFKTFVSLADAEAICVEEEVDDEHLSKVRQNQTNPPFWCSAFLALITLVETFIWLAYGSFQLVGHSERRKWTATVPFVQGATWAYASVRIALAPRPTPHYDLFVLFLAHLSGAILVFVGLLFDTHLDGHHLHPLNIAAYSAHLAGICVLLCVQLGTPIAVPSPYVRPEDIGPKIGPEDYTTLWAWISFRWLNPLIGKGTNKLLVEDDVPKLSSTMQSRVLFAQFSAKKRASLLRWIWDANSFDILLDVGLCAFLDFLSIYVH